MFRAQSTLGTRIFIPLVLSLIALALSRCSPLTASVFKQSQKSKVPMSQPLEPDSTGSQDPAAAPIAQASPAPSPDSSPIAGPEIVSSAELVGSDEADTGLNRKLDQPIQDGPGVTIGFTADQIQTLRQGGFLVLVIPGASQARRIELRWLLGSPFGPFFESLEQEKIIPHVELIAADTIQLSLSTTLQGEAAQSFFDHLGGVRIRPQSAPAQ